MSLLVTRVAAVTNMSRNDQRWVFRTRWIPAAPRLQPQFSSLVAAAAIILIAPFNVVENDSLLPNNRSVFSRMMRGAALCCLVRGICGSMFPSAPLHDNESPALFGALLCHSSCWPISLPEHLSGHLFGLPSFLPVLSSSCLCCCHSV